MPCYGGSTRVSTPTTPCSAPRGSHGGVWMSAAAAAAVVVIAVAAAWLAGLRLPEAGRFQSYANHTGDVAVLHLEDGTQVWLQDGTELRYA